jgi:Tol biopolymer transport system component
VGQDQSEVAGIAFSPDGRRLYFTSDRGSNQSVGGQRVGLGVTYELMLPS